MSELENNSIYFALRESLLGFALYYRQDYEPSRHHRELAQALEKVERGEITRLIVTMPPQRGKSELCSRIFPAWAFGKNPHWKTILVGYSAELAEGFSRDAREIVRSSRYRRVFPNRWLADDTQSVSFWKFANQRGFVKSTGAGGSITGFGADLVILDDPLKDRQQAESEQERQKLWDWYTSVILTRLAPGARVVVVQTRWHEDDLVGRLLEAEKLDPLADKWTVVHFPALDENEQNPLWPERYRVADYLKIKANVGGRDWNALYQGRPTPQDGAIFQRGWFKIEPKSKTPDLERWVLAFDTAASIKNSADWTVGALVGMDPEGGIWIKDIQRWRSEWPDSKKRIIQMVKDYRAQGLEITLGFAKRGLGLPMLQELVRSPELPVAVRPIEEKGDKVERARVWQSRAEAGLLYLVHGEWVNEFIGECLGFPYGKHDDQVDSVSGAVELLYKTQGAVKPVEVPLRNDTWEYFEKLSELNAEQQRRNDDEYYYYDEASGF